MDKETLWTVAENPIGIIQVITDADCEKLIWILNQNGYTVVRSKLPRASEHRQIEIAKYIKSKSTLPLFAVGVGNGRRLVKRIIARHKLFAAAAYTETVPVLSLWHWLFRRPVQDMPTLIVSHDIRAMSLYHQYAEHNLHNLNIVVYPEAPIDASNESMRRDIVQFFNSVQR